MRRAHINLGVVLVLENKAHVLEGRARHPGKVN